MPCISYHFNNSLEVKLESVGKKLRNGGLFWSRVALALSVSIDKELKHLWSFEPDRSRTSKSWMVLS